MTERIVFNGIDGDTGQYLFDPLNPQELSESIVESFEDPRQSRWLKRVWDIITKPHLGLPLDIDPTDSAQSGWGIIYHKDEDEMVKQALRPLVEHRRSLSTDESRVKVLEYYGEEAEDYRKFLARYDVGLGDVCPEKVPYYLLLVGSPARLPFTLGHNLSVGYVVGHLHFDTPKEYARYVHSVIKYETQDSIPNSKEIVLFATRHKSDLATQLSSDHLVAPLAGALLAADNTSGQSNGSQTSKFRLRELLGPSASKCELIKVFESAPTKAPPALLFTATHGMGWRTPNLKQKTTQGSLICQDWPGFGQLDHRHYFSAADLRPEHKVHGMVSFNFACYGAGTPQFSRYYRRLGRTPPRIASEPFFAALPQSLLSHPNGGALACIGHVERVWGWSIRPRKVSSPQLIPFRNALGRIMAGEPVGYAMKDFNERYAALSTYLSEKLDRLAFPGARRDEDELVRIWLERNDAQGYAVIGDPAVRLRIDDFHEEAKND